MPREPRRRARHVKTGRTHSLLKAADLLPPSRFTTAEFAAATNQTIVSAGLAVRSHLSGLSAAYDSLADDQPDVPVPAPRSPEPWEKHASAWERHRRPGSRWPVALSAVAFATIVLLAVGLFQPPRSENAIDRPLPQTTTGNVVMPVSTPPPIKDLKIFWQGSVTFTANGTGFDFDRRPPSPGPATGPVVSVQRTGERLALHAGAAVTLTRYDGKHIPAESDCADFLSRFPTSEVADPQHDDDVCVRTAAGRTSYLNIRDVSSQGLLQAEVKVWLP